MPDARRYPHHRLYSLAAWRGAAGLRRRQLSAEPLCAHCATIGRTTAATEVDHVQPHRGDRALFLDPGNLRSLCSACHTRVTRGLPLTGAGPDGLPVDPGHHWS